MFFSFPHLLLPFIHTYTAWMCSIHLRFFVLFEFSAFDFYIFLPFIWQRRRHCFFFLFIAADCENAIEEERERVVVFNEISHRTPIHNDCTTRTEILDLGVSLERVIQKTVQINNLIKTTWSIQWCVHTEFGRSAQCQVCECSTERKTRKLVCFKCANCVIDCFQTS